MSKTNSKVLYLSGPISGISDYKNRFYTAADQLREMGFTILNPASAPEGLTNADYMRISMAQLEAADAIVLLEGWGCSRGAVIEGLYAAYIGKQIFSASRNPFTGQIKIETINERNLQDIVATGIIERFTKLEGPGV